MAQRRFCLTLRTDLWNALVADAEANGVSVAKTAVTILEDAFDFEGQEEEDDE